VHSLAQLTDPDAWAALLGRGWGEAHTPEFWIAVAKIIWINILLSGDNAVVIALACRSLPPRQRAWGLAFGAGVAVALRVIFTGVIASLMLLPYLKIAGGLALFYIAIKLLQPDDADEAPSETAEHLWRAVPIIAVADDFTRSQLETRLRARLEDAFTTTPTDLWSSVLTRKGGSYALVARLPPDPSVN